MLTEIRNFLRDNFQASFWTANIMELFERIAYYGQAAVLSIYLRDYLHFTEGSAGTLSSIFGGLLYGLPIFAGAIIDKIGFRKSFLFAFSVLSIGYSTLGFTYNFANDTNLFFIVLFLLVFTAIGGSFIKPSVLGTINYTTTEKSKTMGYSIYYWLVNIGGALGPIIAFFFRTQFGIQYVFLVSGISCALMFFSTIIFYKNPKIESNNLSFIDIFNNFVKVIANIKFLIFLFIFALYWIMFWQIFVIIPFYLKDFISKDAPFDLITSTGPITIILLQLVISFITSKLSAKPSIIIGFLISGLSWLIIVLQPSIFTIIVMLVIHSIGEQIQAPKYYEYISKIAPNGQIALYQGFAFLPIAIGWAFGGSLGGYVYEIFKVSSQPNLVFVVISSLGIFSALLMIVFFKIQNK